MNDLHVVTAPREFIRQPVNEDRIPAEVIGRVERRDDTETERPGDCVHSAFHSARTIRENPSSSRATHSGCMEKQAFFRDFSSALLHPSVSAEIGEKVWNESMMR